MKNKMALRTVSFLIMICLMVTIFMFSHQDATRSGNLSGGFTYKLFCLVYPDFEDLSVEEQEQLIGSVEVYIRKTAHFTIYFLLGLSALGFYFTFEKLAVLSRFGLSFLTGSLYAVTDEIHQIYIPGRSGEVRDVFIDSAGVLLACALGFVLRVFINQTKRKKYGK